MLTTLVWFTPGRRLRAFVCGLLFPALAAADGTLQLQSPDGRRQVGAVETRTPITLDGVLDDEAWLTAEPATDFVQAEPHEGQAATERTDGAPRLRSRRAVHRRRLPRRDRLGADRQRHPQGLHARRTGHASNCCSTPSPIAATASCSSPTRPARSPTRRLPTKGATSTPAGTPCGPWRRRRDASGWSAEMRIPFKTLRFERGEGRIWGVNFSRRIRRKNEVDYWSPVPRVYNLYRAGLAGTLTGLRRCQPGTQPADQAVGRGATRRALSAAASSTPHAHAGLDVKYGVTPSLTLDVTVKPDFAQAEADEQQVNLTQFSLFFPEKREFFLENSGMFYFGDIPRESRLGNARFAPPEEEMLLFFSRRIGLTDTGQEIPIAAGGRLTGRVGRTGVGLMTIQTQPDGGRDGDNYTVLRGRRDVLRNSDIGAIFLSRLSAGVVERSQRGRRRRRELPVRAGAQHQRVSRAGRATPGRRRRRDGRQGLDRLERQLPAHAVLAAQRRRQLSRRHRLHQAARASASTSSTSASASGPSGGGSSASASCTRTRATTSTPTSRTRR